LTRIPFNKPGVIGREIEYVQEAIARMHISGDGHFTKRVNSMLEEILAAPKVLLTTSCTHALEMAALLLNLKSGDEFIVPSFTFVSTANAFVLRGARPVFADIRPDTLNLDESRLEPLIGSRTRAIVVVHYAGVGCEMEQILRVAAHHGLPVIEDNAHGLMGLYRGTFLGKFGCLSTLSFHETKNFSCGEGGALVSGGEGQRVRIGRAMSRQNVRLAILDEAFRGLDRNLRHKLLARCRKQWIQATLLCVTHDVKSSLDFDQVLVVDAGTVVESGAPGILASSPDSCYARLLEASTTLETAVENCAAWSKYWVENGKIKSLRNRS